MTHHHRRRHNPERDLRAALAVLNQQVRPGSRALPVLTTCRDEARCALAEEREPGWRLAFDEIMIALADANPPVASLIWRRVRE
jgi:hypothetical protein